MEMVFQKNTNYSKRSTYGMHNGKKILIPKQRIHFALVILNPFKIIL